MLVLLYACASDSQLDRVNEAPSVTIQGPADGTLYRQGVELVAVAGTVSDSFDPPESLTVTWTLDEDSPVAVAADPSGLVSFALDPATLALGPHELTLTVLDLDGAGAYAVVGFEVGGPFGPPVVEITAPADGGAWFLGDLVTFTGHASDTTTPAGELGFWWSSDLQGELGDGYSGDGESALPINTLSLGTHVITLSATDGDGEVGQDQVTVIIEDIVVEPPPPEPGDLIFTELMVNPSVDDEDGEWVELYNTSGSTLDLAGYSFHDDGGDYWVFEASLRVESHEYAVLCANPDPAKNGGVRCDGWFYRNPLGEEPSPGLGYGSGVAIANNDDELVLTSPDGVDIDIFDYDDTESDPIEANRSFGLDPGHLDGDQNDDVDNWCVQTTTLEGAADPGTPGLENDPCE